MATYALIHGASSDSWYWHLIAPALRVCGHDVVAPDLPSDDDAAGFAEYADTVARAIAGRADVIVVAQSMAGFTAPLVCDRVPVRMIVLVAAMTPKAGEQPGEWWKNTGFEQARREQAERFGRSADQFDVMWDFFHDVPPDVTAAAMARGERRQSNTPFEQPWAFAGWPDVPTKFLLCTNDRFFPAEFMWRVVEERLGIVPDAMVSGHLPALAHPVELVKRLETYRTDAGID